MKVRVPDSICDKCGKTMGKDGMAWYLDNDNAKNKGKSFFVFCEFCHDQLQKIWSKTRNDTMVKFASKGKAKE